MNIYRINALPIAELADALQVFEQQFTYPLGKDCFFRIEHGVDYARFYRSIGTACCFVAKHNDQVLAVMSVAIRPLLCPDGSEQTVCYLGDLKIAPAARGGRLLVQLQQAIRDWLPSPDMPSFGVVMEGSRKIPSEYSGRAGIPAFTAVGKTIIMRIACEHPAQGVPHFLSNEAAVRDGYRRLSKGDGNRY